MINPYKLAGFSSPIPPGPISSVKVYLENITVNDGLSQGMVTCFLKDSKGFLWIGTKDGLNVYDGYSFRIYRNSENDTMSIHDNHIVAIYEDRDGMIWIGTMHNGITRFNPRTGKFLSRSSNKRINDNLISKSIRAIAQDYKGNIWISTVSGFNYIQFNSDEHDSFHVYQLSSRFTELPDHAFDVIHWRFLSNNNLELYSRGKIITITEPDNRYHAKATSTAISEYLAFNDNLAFPVFDNNHNITFYISNSGITVYDLTLKKVTKAFRVDIDLRNFPEPLIDRRGRLWVKTKHGFSRYEYETNKLYKIFSANPSVSDALLNDYLSVYKDDNGVLWFGTYGYGILKFTPGRERFKHISGFSGTPMSMSGIYETPDNKIVAQAYQVNDPIVCDMESESFEDFYFKLSSYDKNLRNCNSMVFDSGYAYIGYESLFKYNLKSGVNQKFKLPILNDNDIGVVFDPLFIDSKGRLWCANGFPSGQKMLFRLDKNNGEILQSFLFPGVYMHHEYRFVSDWLEDKDGNFVFGTLDGIYLFNTSTHKWMKPKLMNREIEDNLKNVVFSLCFDPGSENEVIWIGTNGYGLKKLNLSNGDVATFTIENGLPNNVIYGIEFDNKNNLWLSTNNGLCLFDPATVTARNFTEADGLQSTEFNRYAHLKLSDGQLLFGGVNGLNIFNPDDFYQVPIAVNTQLTGLKIDNQLIGIGQEVRNKVLLNIPLEHTHSITFPHDVSMISFSFAYMDLSNPKENRFEYILEGFNKTWIPVGIANEATYTNLSPGDYVFKVRGRKGNGSWSTEDATINLTILSPWYNTIWFRILTAIIIVSILYGFYRYRLAQTLKIQSIRNRIASDLHDEIGSTLSSISLSSTIIQKKISDDSPEIRKLLIQIGSNTDSMMEAMSDIVWAINTNNDRFDNVINRMRAFAIELFEPKSCRIHFNINDEVKDASLDMSQRKNLYLIFKEAVNNVAKYAECSNVWINISLKTANTFLLEIIDDGIGFELNSEPGTIRGKGHSFGGNGLVNMYKRAEEFNANLKITSEVGSGTKVTVKFSL